MKMKNMLLITIPISAAPLMMTAYENKTPSESVSSLGAGLIISSGNMPIFSLDLLLDYFLLAAI